MTVSSATLRLYTVRELAKVARVRVGEAKRWITSGQLKASDLGDGTRSKLRIHPADFEAFLSRRSATPSPPPRRRRKLPTVTEYF
jgi:hypothetical protein